MRASWSHLVCALLTASLLAGPEALAQSQSVSNGCMEDVFANFNGGSGTLNCTANDIEIAAVTNVVVLDDGCAFPGDTVTFNANLTIQLNATARHDVGVFLATDGGDALTGSCLIETVPEFGTALITDLDGTGDDTMSNSAFGYCSTDGGTTLSVPTQPCNEDADCIGGDTCEQIGGTCDLGTNTCDINSTIACNSDADCQHQDTCGDINTASSPITTTITGLTILCVDTDFDGFADLPNCLSWRIPGANDLCLSPLAAFPANASKCKCGIANIIGIPVPKTLKVIKDLIPSDDSGLFNLQIDGDTKFANASNGDMTAMVDVSDGFCTVNTSAVSKKVVEHLLK